MKKGKKQRKNKGDKIKKKRRGLGGYLKIFTLGFVIVYGLNLLYISFLDNKTTTDIAKLTTVHDSVDIFGISVRDEEVLETQKQGNISYLVENSSKVTPQQGIAKIYESASQISAIEQIEKIDEEIQFLRQLQERQVGNIGQEVINKNIVDSIGEVEEEIYKGNYHNLFDKKSGILKSIHERSKILDKAQDYMPKINALEEEKQRLSKDVKGHVKEITSPTSGYFVNYIDGYEELINIENYKEFSVSQIEELVKKKDVQVPEEQFGKILKGYKWNYIITIENRYLDSMSIGKTVQILFPSLSSEPVSFVVQEIKTEENKSVLILESDEATEQLISIRNQPAELIFKSYTGIKVDKDSLRIQNNEKGVYVVEGGINIFKKVNIRLETEEYIIVDANTTDENHLKLYDEIVK